MHVCFIIPLGDCWVDGLRRPALEVQPEPVPLSLSSLQAWCLVDETPPANALKFVLIAPGLALKRGDGYLKRIHYLFDKKIK